MLDLPLGLLLAEQDETQQGGRAIEGVGDALRRRVPTSDGARDAHQATARCGQAASV